MITNIGYLRKGNFFVFEGKKYRVARLIEGTNGYVACVDVESHKVKRFHIDMEIEKVGAK